VQHLLMMMTVRSTSQKQVWSCNEGEISADARRQNALKAL